MPEARVVHPGGAREQAIGTADADLMTETPHDETRHDELGNVIEQLTESQKADLMIAMGTHDL